MTLSYTLERLISGDREVVGYYQAAKEIWADILRRPEAGSVSSLAGVVTGAQHEFEQRCGGRYIGQEIMAFVGIGQFYSNEQGFNGHAREARRVRDALLQSYCSLEVKWHARSAAASYEIEEDR